MIIKLTNSLIPCVVDDEDWFLYVLWKYSWRAKWSSDKRYMYVATSIRLPGNKFRTLYLHRLLLGLKAKKIEGHHKDNDPFNNRRDNLNPLERNDHIQEHVRNPGPVKYEDEVPF